MPTISFKDFVKKAGGKPSDVKVIPSSQAPAAPAPKSGGFFDAAKSFVKDAAGDVVDTGKAIKQSVTQRSDEFNKGLVDTMNGKQDISETLFQLLGNAAGGAADIAGELVTGAAKVALPQSVEDKVKDTATKVISPVVQTQFVQQVLDGYSKIEKENPQLARDIDAALGLGNFALTMAGGAAVERSATGAVKAGQEVVDVASQAAKTAAEKAGAVATTVGEQAGKVRGIGGLMVDEASRIPSRVATNVAEKQAVREAIQTLPTQTAKIAARDGIDIPDVKFLYEIPAEQKPALQKLAQVAKDFSEGKTKTNPIEVVGKPIVTRIQQLEAEAQKVGSQLGEVAKNELGTLQSQQLGSPVFNSLRKVRGLSGIKVNNKGVLDFTDTVLSTALTKSDRQAIQQVFTEAVKGGSGASKHRLRQELFEILGGKKKSLSNITDTQEQAFQAIREGLSTVLETKSGNYKTLSNQYRKIVQPLQDIRKFMKATSNGSEQDILDMSAGLLARRLTSNASSNPQIRSLLSALDAATAVPGKTRLSVETLQDFYNILNKYYDIAGKTSFQSGVQTGVEKAGSIQGVIVKTLQDTAGKSVAVRQKALEDALKEIFNSK